MAKLAEATLKSALGITNPVQANLADLITIYQSQYNIYVITNYC
ncbi:MAG TPA: hypothetical protein ACHBX0_04175 [Arsenophonus sp.]